MMLPRQSEAAVEALQRTQEREGEEWQRNVTSLHELTRFVAANVACYRAVLAEARTLKQNNSFLQRTIRCMYDAFTSEARVLRRDMSECASQVNKINRITEIVHERGQEWAQAEIDDRKKEKDKLTKELNEMWSLSTTYGKALTDYKKECTRHKDKLGELTHQILDLQRDLDFERTSKVELQRELDLVRSDMTALSLRPDVSEPQQEESGPTFDEDEEELSSSGEAHVGRDSFEDEDPVVPAPELDPSVSSDGYQPGDTTSHQAGAEDCAAQHGLVEGNTEALAEATSRDDCNQQRIAAAQEYALELEQALQREQLRSRELEDQLSSLQTKHQRTVEKLKHKQSRDQHTQTDLVAQHKLKEEMIALSDKNRQLMSLCQGWKEQVYRYRDHFEALKRSSAPASHSLQLTVFTHKRRGRNNTPALPLESIAGAPPFG